MNEPFAGRCYMCNREHPACRHYPDLYTHGSEGTTLCQMCQTLVCSIIRDISTRCHASYMSGYHAGKGDENNGE